MIESANSTQIGGEHYKKQNYQTWDFTVDSGFDPVTHTFIKYIGRHRTKNGLEDVKKAAHCLEKLKEIVIRDDYGRLFTPKDNHVEDYLSLNGICGDEASAIHNVVKAVTDFRVGYRLEFLKSAEIFVNHILHSYQE